MISASQTQFTSFERNLVSLIFFLIKFQSNEVSGRSTQ